MEIRTDSKIYKRKDERWCVSYYGMGANPRRHYLYGKTKNEVKIKLAELKHPIQSKQQDAEIENAEREEPVIEVASVEPEAESKGDAAAKQNGANSDAGTKWTLQEWVRYYLVTYKKNEIKETTFDSYMGIYRRRIVKSKIGKFKLTDLTEDDLQKEYNQIILGIYLFIPFLSAALNHIDIRILYVPLLVAAIYLFGVPLCNVFLSAYSFPTLSLRLDLSFAGGTYGFCVLLGYLVKKTYLNVSHQSVLFLQGFSVLGLQFFLSIFL